MKQFHISASLLALPIAIAGVSSAVAQQQPDAGRTIQELKANAPTLPTQSKAPVVVAPATPQRTAGGAKVLITEITITGNTKLTTPELQSLVADAKGKSEDLAGMKSLADRITAYYHAKDYPFARALVPAQSMKGGKLHIEVIEGRYGAVKVEGTDSRAASAQKFLAALKSGDVIEGRRLERASLILDDQPGYTFVPSVRPGTQTGTGDLTENMKRKQKFGGTVGMDNSGNRYTGRIRGTANVYADSPFMFGDRATLSTIYTEEDMWYGAANYSAPIGYSGLRGNVGYAHTYYELGKNFAALDAHGTAKIASAGASYPIIRSQQSNLSLAATYQHKWLKDEQGSTGTSNTKNSDVIPVSLNFDTRDTLGGGGVTYGNFTWTHGVLDLNSSLRSTDRTAANTNGNFDKLNLDVARVQATPVENLYVFARASGQLAGKNLDSSEDFGLGGPDAVRAYPSGEGYGDEGYLAQAEVRYNINNVTPYAFYDYGYVKTNQNPWTTGSNSREIGGAGVGVRTSYKGWNADASAAWRTNGGQPQSDTQDNIPQLWVKVGYTF